MRFDHPQPDRRSCGAASIVMARILRDETYAGQVADRFGAEVLDTHARVTGWWPRALGTPPWSVRRELSRIEQKPYRWRLRPDLEAVRAHARAGDLVVLYVGNRWLPRHVVLVVGAAAESLEVYEPSSGQRRVIEGEDVDLAGWRRLWFSVEPASPVSVA